MTLETFATVAEYGDRDRFWGNPTMRRRFCTVPYSEVFLSPFGRFCHPIAWSNCRNGRCGHRSTLARNQETTSRRDGRVEAPLLEPQQLLLDVAALERPLDVHREPVDPGPVAEDEILAVPYLVAEPLVRGLVTPPHG